jgi:hypothetical protein
MCPDLDDLPQAFQAHLAREEDALNHSLAVLGRVRTALLRSDLAELTALREPQEEAAAETSRLQQQRDELRERLAAALGLPAARVNLSKLIDVLPAGTDWKVSLQGAAERVRRLAVGVDALIQSNASLLSHLVRFTHGVLCEITGGEEAAPGYGRYGTHLEGSFGSLLSTRG